MQESDQSKGMMNRIRANVRYLAPAMMVPGAIVGFSALMPGIANAAPATPAGAGHHSATANKCPKTGKGGKVFKCKTEVECDLEAYFDAGYDYDDAVLLARLWDGGISPSDAKVKAGQQLLKGKLEVKHGATPWTVSGSVAAQAFFNHGYDYYDAMKLAKAWGKKDVWQVKQTAGRKLLAGLKLPV